MVYTYQIISIIASTVKGLTFQLNNKDYQIWFFKKSQEFPGSPMLSLLWAHIQFLVRERQYKSDREARKINKNKIKCPKIDSLQESHF